MKITGLILAAIGLVAGAACLVQMLQSTPAGENAPPRDAVFAGGMIVPLVISVAAIVAGALMFMYGGRGYVVANDPRVRN